MKNYFRNRRSFVIGIAVFFVNILLAKTASAQKINNGVPWFDNNNAIVNAHGACLVYENGKYYLFGEYKTDSINKFNGFSCYSSPDLATWKFERLVLPVQKDGLLSKNRIGERVKVMRSPETKQYVMFMHCDDQAYNDPYIGYAVCNTIDGNYEFKGPILYHNLPIRKWDMGTFQDTNGDGYLLIHHGEIYKLSNDYCSLTEKISSQIPGSGESPAMFKKGNFYYLLYSNLTSWERNDNYYYSAKHIKGPWKKHGYFSPEGSLTHNSQTSFVFPLQRGNDTLHMYMGDRWSFPRQASSATYVWLPLIAKDTLLEIPAYLESWHPYIKTVPDSSEHTFNLSWTSEKKGDKKLLKFSGTGVTLIGKSGPDGGYAKISVLDKNGKSMTTTLVDFYSKKNSTGQRFVSPKLPMQSYTLMIEVLGENSTWSNKAKTIFYGSNGCRVDVDSAIIKHPKK